MRKKRVLLLSEGFGSGHTHAAHAIAAGLRKLSDQVVTRVLELGAFQHPVISSWVFSAYRRTVTMHPELYGKLYHSQSQKSLSRLKSMALHKLFYSKTQEIIQQLKPDVIVCTHPFPIIVVSRLKRVGLRIPLCAVVTDYDAHGSWIENEVNVYLVSTPEVKAKFIRQGVPEHKLEVTGIPVHPKFWSPLNKEETRQQFGLNTLPTVMVMGGGWGLIQDDIIIKAISRWKNKLQFVLCLGNNEKALRDLSAQRAWQHPNIRLVGYTKDIHKLMDVSDILITKPGGLTCTEAMAKALPMLFYSLIPGQEEENSHYFVENGHAYKMDTKRTLDLWLGRLVNEHATFVAEREQRLANQHASDAIYRPEHGTETILQLLRVSAVEV